MSDEGLQVNNTLGALLNGLLTSSILYGFACVQTIIYYRQYPNDGRLTKVTVALTCFFNSFQLFVAMYSLNRYLIGHYGDINVLHSPHWSLPVQVVFWACSDFLVRCFFARRIVILSNGPCLPKKYVGCAFATLILLLSGSVLIIQSVYGIKIYKIIAAPHSPENVQKQLALVWMMDTFQGGAAAADILISMSLCTLLLLVRTGFKKTKSLLTYLMAFSISSGILTSIMAIGALVIYKLYPTSLLAFAFGYVVCQLHVNSLLLSLNARHILRDMQSNLSTTDNFPNDSIAYTASSGPGPFSIPLQNTPQRSMVATKETTSYTDSERKPADTEF